MTPTNRWKIPEGWQRVVFAKDQPQYMPLPAAVSPDDGMVKTCWALTWCERLRLLLVGRLYLTLLTLGHPLQPVKLEVV